MMLFAANPILAQKQQNSPLNASAGYDIQSKKPFILQGPIAVIYSDNSACVSDNSVLFDGTKSINSAYFKWWIDDNLIDTSASFSFTFQSAGTYKIHLEVFDKFGGSNSADHRITIHINPIADFNIDSLFCYSKSNTASPQNNSRGHILKYTWNYKDQVYFDYIPEFALNSIGIDSVFLVVEDRYSCKDQMAKSIRIAALPYIYQMLSGEFNICQGDFGVFWDVMGNDSISWYKNDEWISNQHDSIIITDEASYHFIVWSAEGCKIQSDPIYLFVHKAPVKPTITEDSGYLISSKREVSIWYKIDTSWHYIDTLQRIKPASPGKYMLRVDSNGCVQFSDTFNLTQRTISHFEDHDLPTYPSPDVPDYRSPIRSEFVWGLRVRESTQKIRQGSLIPMAPDSSDPGSSQ